MIIAKKAREESVCFESIRCDSIPIPIRFVWNRSVSKKPWKNDRVNQYWQWNIITNGFITAHSIHLRAPFYQNSIQYLIYYFLFSWALLCIAHDFPRFAFACESFCEMENKCAQCFASWIRQKNERKRARTRATEREIDYWAVGNEPLITNELRVKLSIIWCAL